MPVALRELDGSALEMIDAACHCLFAGLFQPTSGEALGSIYLHRLRAWKERPEVLRHGLLHIRGREPLVCSKPEQPRDHLHRVLA